MSGGAAEVMQARGLERIVRQTDALTAVEVLHRRLVVETAAFEQQDLVPRADPFQRHADAGRASAHDAQVGFEHAAVRKGSSVDVHGGMSGGGQSERREKRALWRASVTETTHPCSTIVRPTAKSCSTSPAIDGGHGRAARMAAYSACTSFSLGTSARYRSPILRTACGPIRERRSGCANVSRSTAGFALAPRVPPRPTNALAALTPRNWRRFMLTSGTRPC